MTRAFDRMYNKMGLWNPIYSIRNLVVILEAYLPSTASPLLPNP